MKVSELETGMLLECVSDEWAFVLSEHSATVKPWLMITKRRRKSLYRQSIYDQRIREEKFIIYLGTKKDTNIDMQWCDKFVLIGNQIAGVDPAVWRNLRMHNGNC